ncbi:hypothetical protein AB0D08_14140 [Kitasatospora sp. NPDC048540]|uniref:hypothetical protein n=1 Tax=unclassified Kitasatospora TaxID=2633591 RepID=UPI0009EBCC13|nr:hypothetical protein [Kitasatospora sp. MBT63]
MFRTGRTFLAATAVVLALTATGCNSKSSGGDAAPAAPSAAGSSVAPSSPAAEVAPAALLKLVGEKTSAAKSAKVEAVTELPTGKTSMKGAISWDHGLQGELTGNAGGAMADTLAKAGGDGTFTARYLTDAMYINMGEAMAGQLGGAHWIKYGYADLAKLMGPAGDSLKQQLQSADPVSSVRALIASGKVAKAGSESVNGTQATKYAGDLSAADLAQATTQGLTKEQADGLQQQFTAAGITTEHIELWVTGDNLLVKKVEQLQTKAGAITSTATYTDYGTSVAATAPSEGDTVDFAKLLQGAQSAS